MDGVTDWNQRTNNLSDSMNRPYHFHGNSGQHHFNYENRCYIDHRGERRTMSAPEYKIRTETIAVPKTGGFYKDNDDDVFVYLGGTTGDPWLQIEDIGAYTRSASYPAQPLLELTPEEYSAAIRELRA